MKIPLGLVALLAASVLARADVVIVESIAGPGQSGQMTIKVGADKIRVDVSPMLGTITDVTTGDVTTLMLAQKSYMIISAAQAKAAVNAATAMAAAGGTPLPSPAPPAPTGRTEKINGYDAAEYTWSNGGMSATYWMAKGFPNEKLVIDALAKYRKGSMAAAANMFTADTSSLPGVPIRTEISFNGQKIVTELVSANEANVDPSVYQVPSDFTQIKMPPIPQAPGQ
jgi:ABC-type branched-subunit amino acid transport system substrate-binding protein